MFEDEGTRRKATTIQVSLFALHTFLLMATGTWSDLAMGGEPFGATLYYLREGMLAAGFLLHAALARHAGSRPLPPAASRASILVLVGLFAASIAVFHVSGPGSLRVAAALGAALLVGMSGGMAYEGIALSVPRRASGSRALGLIVGSGGALAVLLQFALQSVLTLGGWLGPVLVVSFGLTVWLARSICPARSKVLTDGADGPEHPEAEPLASMVVAAFCLFALLLSYDSAVRASGADPSIFYGWPRLFLIVGYAGIGMAAHLGGRRPSSVVVVVSALFTIIVLVQTTLSQASALTAVLFYALLGAALAWGGIAFMRAAPGSAHPALIASTWRILSSLVTIGGSLIQNVGALPLTGALACSLALLATVVVAMVKGGFFEHAEADEGGSPPSTEDRVRLVVRDCKLTDREREVLEALVLTEMKNQQIADDLGISRRQLQNHVSRIYEKTGTATRAGLVARVDGER